MATPKTPPATAPTPPTDGIAGQQVQSAVRVAVGSAVAVLVTLAAHFGMHVDGSDLATKVMPEAFVGYNGLVRVLEHRYPQLGWLLGAPRS